MRNYLIIFVLANVISLVSAKNNAIHNYIFIPHPRSEDNVKQSVLPTIEKIDMSKYSITLLGGDLTYYTSINSTSMNYLDNLFNLSSPNTMWTMGNHDLALSF